MSKRKPMDKTQARERRNRMLDSAADANLSLTEGVREMRAIAGMTQEEFARHRGVSARVIKAIELGQGNPTVATLNRIGQFFGLEVAFVPIRRETSTEVQPQFTGERMSTRSDDLNVWEDIRKALAENDELAVSVRQLGKMVAELSATLSVIPQPHKTSEEMTNPVLAPVQAKHRVKKEAAAGETRTRTKKKSPSR